MKKRFTKDLLENVIKPILNREEDESSHKNGHGTYPLVKVTSINGIQCIKDVRLTS
jgi:hypothetical protein